MKNATLTLIDATGHRKGAPYRNKITILKKHIKGLLQESEMNRISIAYSPYKGQPGQLIRMTFPTSKDLEENYQLLYDEIFQDTRQEESSIYKASFNFTFF